MPKPIIQNAFSLASTQVIDVKYHTEEILNKNISKDLNLNMTHKVLVSPDISNKFMVEFYADLKNKNNTIYIEVKLLAVFETEKEITDDFKESQFVHINAPAIAFPYLRSFITNLTVSAGINPIILPTFNFTKTEEIEDKDEIKT